MATIGFKELARRHQIKFRKEVLKVGEGAYETHLTEADALKGLIFYNGFNIFEVAKGRLNPHLEQNKACFANMLRSEHIPFNFFVPLINDLGYAKDVLNKFLCGVIDTINVIKIEYAPDPELALKDKTSFDVYIEYKHFTGTYGILGIEVKYTEKEYKLIEGSKEDREIHAEDSIYNLFTNTSGLYKKEFVKILKTDEYRQVWRNHLLGMSMINKNHADSRFDHFTSIILYPEGNDHFRNLIPAYRSFLNQGYESSFIGITYEKFLMTAQELIAEPEYLRWLQYLEDRYIV
ncbi:MAG: hypothetical protein NTX93_06890 [Bacteroidia bacterium]|nr:hypothetical protein [Bacteroidia bacterium]